MQKRTLKVTLLAVLAIILVLGIGGTALAQTWTDMPATVTAKYGLTNDQVASISEGYPNGLWCPYTCITRAQFTKMAVEAFDIPLKNPDTASFTDVPKGSFYYQYIEGAKAASVILGVTGGTTFEPQAQITRIQAVAIVSRWIAAKSGFDLTTMTAAQIDGFLVHFGDKASIPENLKAEAAYAYECGFAKGDAYGNLCPAACLTRIQAAAFLIRAEACIPPAQFSCDKIEIVSGDKSENLIGQKHEIVFKVTDKNGHPSVGVNVDFDVMQGSSWFVGNVQPDSQKTDAYGQVTATVVSSEPGTEKLSATVKTSDGGEATVVATKYWLVLDECYITDDARDAENNVGEAHNWSARVVVFGPGPRSTSPMDWYNAVSTATFDPTDISEGDGVDAAEYWYLYYYGNTDKSADYYWGWDNQFEKHLLGYYDLKPRTMAGIDVAWSIKDYKFTDPSKVDDELYEEGMWDNLKGGSLICLGMVDDDETVQWVKFGSQVAAWEVESGFLYARAPKVTVAKTVTVTYKTEDGVTEVGDFQYVDATSTVASVGNITAVDGTAITAAKTATGKTNADGLSSIKIESQVTGKTYVEAVAGYADNPYPKQLFSHETYTGFDYHDSDWYDQPYEVATAYKTWIPHVIDGTNGLAITAASLTDNTGEVEKFTLTLKDTYGNVIPGYSVQWWIQGVGQFKDDYHSWSGVGQQNNNVVTTDANGQAVVYVTSGEAGQTILHCKVMDKYGLPYKEGNVVKQWYSIDDVRFLPTLDADGEEVPAVNLVGTSHTFTAAVSGMKKVFTVYDVNGNGLNDDQVLIGDRADLKAASGYIINFEGDVDEDLNSGGIDEGYKPCGVDLPAGRVLEVQCEKGTFYFTRFADMTLSGAEKWVPTCVFDPQAEEWIKAVWSGLAGKNVWFYNNISDENGENGDYPFKADRSAYPTDATGAYPMFVGKITSPTTLPVVTDANGLATVTVTSTEKGYEYVWAVADYTDNWQDGDPEYPADWAELHSAEVTKTWVASGDTTNIVYGSAGQNANGPVVAGTRFTNPIIEDWYGYQYADGDYQAYGSADDDNPNYDILAVSVTDQYGNALPGYLVTFEILDQGHEDGSGATATYHPYAHFGYEGILSQNSDYEYDFGHTTDELLDELDTLHLNPKNFKLDKDGIFDRATHVDANPLWDSDGDDYVDEDEYGKYDADMSAGYTLDGDIDGNVDLSSAAFATLVLDETYSDLEYYDHIATQVNVQVYNPQGTKVGEKLITKVWSIDQPELASLSLVMSATGDEGTYKTALSTDVDPVYVLINALDQYGNPYDGSGEDLYVQVIKSGSATDYYSVSNSDIIDNGDGTYSFEFSPNHGGGAYYLTPFVDGDGNGKLGSGDTIKGAKRTLTWAS